MPVISVASLFVIIIVVLIIVAIRMNIRMNIMKASSVVSVIGIIAGALMIINSHCFTPPMAVTGYIGAALACTGMIALTISETFKKP